MQKKRQVLIPTQLATQGKFKKKCEMTCSGSQTDSLGGMCSLKSSFLIFTNSDLPYIKSDLSFKPYAPEEVFTVFSFSTTI